MTTANFFTFKKLPARTTSVVFAFYMSAIMAFLMCVIITAANNGVSNHYLISVLSAYKVAMPAAFICIMIVRPIVMRLVAKTVAS